MCSALSDGKLLGGNEDVSDFGDPKFLPKSYGEARVSIVEVRKPRFEI